MMTLEEYRNSSNLTYQTLSERLGFSLNKTYRICKNEECIRLRDAYQIVDASEGKVTMIDLLPEGC